MCVISSVSNHDLKKETRYSLNKCIYELIKISILSNFTLIETGERIYTKIFSPKFHRIKHIRREKRNYFQSNVVLIFQLSEFSTRFNRVDRRPRTLPTLPALSRVCRRSAMSRHWSMNDLNSTRVAGCRYECQSRNPPLPSIHARHGIEARVSRLPVYPLFPPRY